MTPYQIISKLDKQINDLRRQSPPNQHELECELFRQRGEAQLVRDDMEHRLAAKRWKPFVAKQCPTCGHHTIY